MKRRIGMTALLALALIAVRAQTARADGNGAVVVSINYCLVYDATCSNGALYAPVRQFSVTNTAGNSTITCKADLPAGATLPSDGAVKCDFASTGQHCTGAKPDGSPDFSKLSTDWTEVITPGGQASLVCHFKNQ